MRARYGFLAASSTRAGQVGEVVSGQYDLALLSGSWDERALSVLGAPDFHAKQAILLCFSSRHPKGKENEATLRHFLSTRGMAVHPVEGIGEDVESEWPRIWSLTRSLIATGSRCFIDLTACPRYYSLGLIAGLLSVGLAGIIDVLYTEGIYGAPEGSPDMGDFPFSKGRWSRVAIPFLEGRVKPAWPKLYVVSLGFEGTKTQRLLDQEDPARIALLYPIPGVLPEYEAEVEARNTGIRERFAVPASAVVRAAAGDAVGAWSALRGLNPERDHEDAYYMCCGTKAHALGMALRALSLGSPTVLYNVPERHNPVPVRAAGGYWLYRIRDVSAVAGSHVR